ncbi:MAG: cytochrome c3 family protein [Tepidisphaeraceae bacterium]
MNLRRLNLVLALLIGIAVQARAQTLQNMVESRRDCAVCHLEWSVDFDKPGAVLLMDKPTVSMASRETTCLGCHDGSVRDSRKKVWQEQSHKTGVKPPPTMTIPTGLPLEDGKLACRTCHTAHNLPGAEDLSSTFFLRVDNDQSQLCRICHAEKADGPTHGSHPVGPMPVAMPGNLLAAGAKSGPKGQELICQSCHAAHGSQADKLLVLTASDNALCISCHEKLRPGQWGAAGHTHPVSAPLSTDVQRQAIREMGTHAGSRNTLACLSCHRLHDSPAKAKLLADTLSNSKLCLRCHPDQASVAATLHDLRKTAPTTRNSLGQTAQDSGPCSACHTPHQTAQAPVVAKGDPTGACQACHAEGRLAAAKGATHFNHPDDLSRANLPEGLSLSVAPGKTNPERVQLTCMTCHNPHDAARPRFLRDRPDQLCGACHVEQTRTLAGSHDFTHRPTVRNGLGKSVEETGKCGFCHNVHHGNGPAIWIATKTAPATAADMCVQCHNKTGLAADHPAPLFSHPTGIVSTTARPAAVPLPLFDAAGQRVESHGLVQCASCHNPHADSGKSSLMLRVPGNTSDLCLRCHAEKSTLFGGIHDSMANPAWPGVSAGKDLCMACHRAHANDPTRKLWAVTPASGAATADGVCIACHRKNGWAVATDGEATPSTPAPAVGAMMHPQIMPVARSTSDASTADAIPLVGDCPLPLVPAIGSESRTRIGCETCHNPHAGRGERSLLRSPDPSLPERVCFQCHKSEATLDQSMHAKNVLARSPANTDPTSPANSKLLCAPCHAVHAVDGSQRDKLWASRLDFSAVTPNEQRCLGCHDDQTARRPSIPEHPSVAFGLLKWSAAPSSHLPEYLPTERSIPCGVCHLPHGNKNAGQVPVLAAGTMLSPEQLITLRGAAKPMMRPSVAHDLCATCHGGDADRVFLYYHHSQQRQDIKALQDPTGSLEEDQ